MRRRSKGRSKSLSAKEVALPVALIVVLTLGGAAIIAELYYNGSISLDGLGTVILTGRGNSTGQSVIPIGKLSFSMQLVAGYADGSNVTLSTVGNLPSLDVIQVNNKVVNQVVGRAAVVFLSATSYPLGTLGNFGINYTVHNEKSGFTLWRYYAVQEPMLVNGTVAVAMLPDFALSGNQVYSDVCSHLSNGTLTCTGTQNGNSLTRRVDWSILANLNVTTPLSLIPQSYQSSIVSTADFTASGAFNSCMNCNGAPTNPTSLKPNSGDLKIGAPPSSGAPPSPTGTIVSFSQTQYNYVGKFSGAGDLKADVKQGLPDSVKQNYVEKFSGGSLIPIIDLIPGSYMTFAFAGSTVFASPVLVFLMISGLGGVLALTVFFLLRMSKKRG